jgi:hypothetical protein
MTGRELLTDRWSAATSEKYQSYVAPHCEFAQDQSEARPVTVPGFLQVPTTSMRSRGELRG